MAKIAEPLRREDGLHLITKNGMRTVKFNGERVVYSKETLANRRCCEMCGVMCWAGMPLSAQHWTDNLRRWRRSTIRCNPVV